MSDDQNPLIRLEPGGSAPILSYNVPEPTKYGGRTYIELQLDASYFRTDLPPLPPPPLPTMLVAGRQALAAGAPGQVALRYPEGDRVSDKLARINPDDVQEMQRMGMQLQVYYSMTGKLTYRYVKSEDLQVRSEPPRAVEPAADGGGEQ